MTARWDDVTGTRPVRTQTGGFGAVEVAAVEVAAVEVAAVGSGPATGPGVRLVSGRPRRGAAVAVCVPVYQGGEHLSATLRSVLAQTFGDVEVVVLDNASTDGTRELLARLDDPRVTVWRNDATVPMEENFNRVVALSAAPLVKVLPADDLLEPDCLALQVAALRDDPTLAFVAGRAHLVDAEGRLLAPSRFLRGLRGRRERAAVVRRVVRSGANPIGGDVAVTFRRTAFTAAGGYAPGGMHADVDLQVRLLRYGGFLGQAETVARFRVAPTTRSAAGGRDDFDAQRAWTRALAAGEPVVRPWDRWIGRLGAVLARRRRELVFALVRARAARDATDRCSSAGAVELPGRALAEEVR